MDKFIIKLQGKPEGYKPCVIDIAPTKNSARSRRTPEFR